MNMMVPAPQAGATQFEFSFDGHPVRGLMIGEKPVFVAADLARALRYRDASNLVRVVRAREKGTHSMSTLGGEQRLTTVTESGLYRAIMARKVADDRDVTLRLDIERFQDWVVEEVLPTIRRTGSYPATTAPAAPTAVSMLEALKDPTTMLAVIEHHARETLAERAAHALTHQRLEESTAAGAILQAQVEADRPAVLAQQRIGAAKGELLLSDVAVTIGVDRIRVVEWLVSLGFLRRGGDRRLRCTREGRLSGWVRGTAELAEEPTAEESGRCRIRVTGNGLRALSEHFCRGAAATSQDVIPGF